MGAGSEALCIYRALGEARSYNEILYWVFVGILVTYPPGKFFPYEIEGSEWTMG